MSRIVEIVDLTKYINGRLILENVTFHVEKGEIFTIIGGSGSGKTSITKHIVGLWKPTKGYVKVFGKDVASMSFIEIEELRKDIGYVFQQGALFDSLTVWENVGFFFLEHEDMEETEIKKIVKEKLELVNLGEEVMDLLPSELSGGMRKRVAIARAIATNPRLIIYDEPTSGLDPITSRVIDDLIVSLRDKTGTTSIVVTHDMVSAFKISDRMLILNKGRVVQIGTPSEIMRSDIPFVRDFIRKGLGEASIRTL